MDIIPGNSLSDLQQYAIIICPTFHDAGRQIIKDRISSGQASLETVEMKHATSERSLPIPKQKFCLNYQR
jgi:hypothetical protein